MVVDRSLSSMLAMWRESLVVIAVKVGLKTVQCVDMMDCRPPLVGFLSDDGRLTKVELMVE